MPIQETLDSLLAQAGEHFDVAFEPLDVDGHPARGDFLPPVPLPRRM